MQAKPDRDGLNSVARPAWIRRQENGALGEARTKAFLLDRFWVLERSVDIEGADFLIQQRLVGQSLMDPAPPRLGLVQSKFYSTTSTSHLVPTLYALDETGAPRTDFFVVAHTGTAGTASTYLITSTDLVAGFAQRRRKATVNFILPGHKVLCDRYRVLDPDRALDAIESALRRTDFLRNRLFIRWLLPSTPDPEPIAPDYEEPIPNSWGEIADGMKQMRRRAQLIRYEAEDLREMLVSLETTGDPLAALDVAELIDARWGPRLPLTPLYDSEFHQVLIRHRSLVDQLRGAGLLEPFVAARKALVKQLDHQLSDYETPSADCLVVANCEWSRSGIIPIKVSLCRVPQSVFPSEVVKAARTWPLYLTLSCEERTQVAIGSLSQYGYRLNGLAELCAEKVLEGILDVLFAEPPTKAPP